MGNVPFDHLILYNDTRIFSFAFMFSPIYLTVYMSPPPPHGMAQWEFRVYTTFQFSDLSSDLVQCLDDDLHIMAVQLICDGNCYFTAKSNKYICIFIYVHTLAHNFVTVYPI